jgi:hypothetical protein
MNQVNARIGLFVGVLCMLMCTEGLSAVVGFTGRAPISYGSSIPGIWRHDVLYFDLVIEDSALDTDDRVFSNAFGGVTALGQFNDGIVYFRLHASSSNLGYYDPIDVTYDYSRSYFTTIDAGPGPGAGNDHYSEKMKLIIPVSEASLSAGAPFRLVIMNLYNGTLYDTPATSQVWIDESASGNPTSFADFFLRGTKTLEEFRSVGPADASNARDGIFLEGLSGTGQLASGEGVTLAAVPEPSCVSIWCLGLAWTAWRKRKCDSPGLADTGEMHLRN